MQTAMTTASRSAPGHQGWFPVSLQVSQQLIRLNGSAKESYGEIIILRIRLVAVHRDSPVSCPELARLVTRYHDPSIASIVRNASYSTTHFH